MRTVSSPAARRGYRPRLELLEDRCLLAAGALDPTFGTGGRVITDILGPATDTGYEVLALAGGKTLVAGTTRGQQWGHFTPNSRFALARYNADGSLDVTFGIGGRVDTDFGRPAVALAAAAQSDGRIVVAGTTTVSDTTDFALARYNLDGSLDATFGVGGKVTTDFSGSDDVIESVAIQGDGRIVVAGSSRSGATADDFAVARYNPDGSLDTSFGSGGRVTTDFASAGDKIFALAVDTAGRIVVAGQSLLVGTNYDFALARYNPNGSLDPTFGTGGKVTTDLGYADHAYGMALRPDGRIVTAGVGGGFRNWSVVAYTLDGSLDTSFDGDGKVTTDIGGGPSPAAVAIQADGRIVVAGTVNTSSAPSRLSDADFAVARYNPDGSLDASFGSGGTVVTDLSNVGKSRDVIESIAIRPDGQIVVAGVTESATSGYDFVVARYTPPGSLDTSFGGTGWITTDFPTPSANLAGLHTAALQPDGKILMAGTMIRGGGFDFLLARYNPDGSLDTTFGAGGIVLTDIWESDFASSVTLQPDGRILVGGRCYESYIHEDYAFGLVRYNPNGTLDTTFGTGGKVTTDLGPGSDDVLHSLTVQPDGRIVAAGYTYRTATGYDFAAVRYNADGSMDASFGTGGTVVTDLGSADDQARDVLVLSDGRIVLGGYSVQAGTGSDFALVRYTAAGVLDATFGSGGKVFVDFGGTNDAASGLALYPGGRMVVSGTPGLARLNADGTLDASFDGDGRALIGGGRAVAVQPDGRIVLGWNNVVDRYNPDGTIDLTFDGDGRVSAGFDVYGVLLQPDGRIVAAGDVYRPTTGQDFALARFDGGNRPPTAAITGAPATGLEGTPISLGSAVTDPDPGDTFTYAWSVTRNGGAFASGTGPSFGFTPTDDGSYAVTLTVRDAGGLTGTDSKSIAVSNVAPAVGPITAPVAPVQVGTVISVSASFTDPGVLDTHTAQWDWGDGSSPTSGVLTESNGSGTVTATRSYPNPGVYEVRLIVTDKDGASSAPAYYRYVVVYDPAAGSVTGGGRVSSPAGALVGSTASGNASFGFNARYHNGATTPTGHTNFNFPQGDFHFRSSDYALGGLVVNGFRAQVIGTGTVNGASGYSFRLTVYDGDLPGGGGTDRFRLKVWNTASSAVVYDNVPGAPDDLVGANPQPISNGNVVIHGSAQTAGGRPKGDQPESDPLSAEQLASLVPAAIARWGLDADSLGGVEVLIADLDDDRLGLTSGNTIWIDDDAAGWGWFVDATPFDDNEFTTAGDQGEEGRMDLLSVLMHEIGHVLGFEHEDDGVMHETLGSGERSVMASDTPTPLDEVFSAGRSPAYWGDLAGLLDSLTTAKKRPATV